MAKKVLKYIPGCIVFSLLDNQKKPCLEDRALLHKFLVVKISNIPE
jgi:hypothetical protein